MIGGEAFMYSGGQRGVHLIQNTGAEPRSRVLAQPLGLARRRDGLHQLRRRARLLQERVLGEKGGSVSQAEKDEAGAGVRS